MRLENLYENFGQANPDRQAEMLSEYRLRRATDLASATTTKTTKKKTESKPKAAFSEEERMIMKMLGLTQKDVLALRANREEEVVSDTSLEDEAAALLNEEFCGDDEEE